MPETPKRSGERLVRGKPKPPERDAMHQYLGQEAARLLSVYRRVKKKRGRPPRGQKQGVQAVKAAALDLLYNTGAPVSLISLFNVMLGGVVLARPDSTLPWLDLIVDYEARVNNENRLVDNAEITDKVVLPNHPELSDRKHVMRQVKEIRDAVWYPRLRDARRVYLIDDPDSV